MSQVLVLTIPAIFGVAGYLYKVWADKVKSRKLVLFHLLEIHYTLKIIPVSNDGLVERFLEHYRGLLEEAGFPVDVNYQDIIEQLKPLMHEYFENLYSAIPNNLDEEFKESFNCSLVALAKDNPVLAYKLKGKQSLEKITQAVKSYTTDLEAQPGVTDNELIGSVVKDEISESAKKAYAEILDEVNGDIIRVASGCGPLTYWNCRKAINKKIVLDDEFSELGLDEKFNSFMQKIIAEANKKVANIDPV